LVFVPFLKSYRFILTMIIFVVLFCQVHICQTLGNVPKWFWKPFGQPIKKDPEDATGSDDAQRRHGHKNGHLPRGPFPARWGPALARFSRII
jgi:hypothetical protein